MPRLIEHLEELRERLLGKLNETRGEWAYESYRERCEDLLETLRADRIVGLNEVGRELLADRNAVRAFQQRRQVEEVLAIKVRPARNLPKGFWLLALQPFSALTNDASKVLVYTGETGRPAEDISTQVRVLPRIAERMQKFAAFFVSTDQERPLMRFGRDSPFSGQLRRAFNESFSITAQIVLEDRWELREGS